MAPPLPATEWALPCQNVFDWKIQTEKFPLFPLPHCFSRSSSCLSPPVFCPSFIAHRKGSSFSPVKLSLNAAFAQTEGGKRTLPSSPSFSISSPLPLAGAVPEPSVSVRYLPVSQKSISHENMMSISRVLSVEQCRSRYLLSEAIMIRVQPTDFANKTCGELNSAVWVN